MDSTGKKKIYLTNCSLDPRKGALCHCLDWNGHWPSLAPRDRSGNVTPCHLHRWACGSKAQKHSNVIYCGECNVVLCSNHCFRLFHEIWDLPAEKDNVRAQLQELEKNSEK